MAGSRTLINVILLHVTSTLQTQGWRVKIFPNFSVKATFKTDSGEHSFSGLVDYVLVHLPLGAFSGKPTLYPLCNCLTSVLEIALNNSMQALRSAPEKDKTTTPIVIVAKKNNLVRAIPQAAIAAASYCKQQRSANCFLHLT
jgi:hypothetical protein